MSGVDVDDLIHRARTGETVTLRGRLWVPLTIAATCLAGAALLTVAAVDVLTTLDRIAPRRDGPVAGIAMLATAGILLVWGGSMLRRAMRQRRALVIEPAGISIEDAWLRREQLMAVGAPGTPFGAARLQVTPGGLAAWHATMWPLERWFARIQHDLPHVPHLAGLSREGTQRLLSDALGLEMASVPRRQQR